MTATEKKELEKEILQLEKENDLMKKLSTRKGFFEMFFKNIKIFKNRLMAFNYVNQLYFDLFGVYRYENFLIFSQTAKP